MKNYFKALNRFGIKPGLERIQALLSYLGDPHNRYATVHIAGTNGKGSVTAIVSQVLSTQGYNVGVFTSPHLHSYGERIRVNQKLIGDDVLWSLINEMESAIKSCESAGHGNPTEFEILTALAFSYFERQGVDIAVIETGMGGTYDSTNVVSPVVTAITNVGLDHLQHLGPELQDVAYNKAGIIKSGVPLIYGDHHPVVFEILSENCARLGSSLHLAEQTVRFTRIENLGLGGFVLDISTAQLAAERVKFSLPGSFQLENLTTALAIIDQLHEGGFPISQESLIESLPVVKWPGRLERVKEHPEVILDASHNQHGAEGLSQALEEIYPEQSRILVIGILDDKNGPGIFQSLKARTRICIVTRPEGDRASNWLDRYQQAAQIFTEVYAVESIEEAVHRALASALAREYILITGSFKTLDRARRMFTQT